MPCFLPHVFTSCSPLVVLTESAKITPLATYSSSWLGVAPPVTRPSHPTNCPAWPDPAAFLLRQDAKRFRMEKACGSRNTCFKTLGKNTHFPFEKVQVAMLPRCDGSQICEVGCRHQSPCLKGRSSIFRAVGIRGGRPARAVYCSTHGRFLSS